MARAGVVIGAALAVQLVASVSGGETWFGTAKTTTACAGDTILLKEKTPVSVTMLPGTFQSGASLVVGGVSVPGMFSDRIRVGSKELFAASLSDSATGLFTVSGTLKGSKLKGIIEFHDYANGCVGTGRVKAKRQ